MSDLIDTVRTLAPQVAPDPALLARVRQDLMADIAPESSVPSLAARRRSPKRRWLVPVVAAIVLATSAAGWAVAQRGSATNTGIECPVDTSGRSFEGVDATTGDPIADCGVAWRSLNHSDPPAMTAYRAPGGGVLVRLASEPAPKGSRVLPSGVAVDTQIIELTEALSDIGHGVTILTCHDEQEARTQVQAELDRIGLDGWRIEGRENKPIDADHPCAWAVVRGEDAVVELLGSERWPAEAQVFHDYATRLQAGLAADCRDLDGADALARRLASEPGLPTEVATLSITPVAVPSARCTTATVTVGGAVLVTLRGPA